MLRDIEVGRNVVSCEVSTVSTVRG